MNRIILAYSSANADLAQRIDNQLSRIGIPFEHVRSSNGNFATALVAPGEPVLLLVTDNLLKERGCMNGLMDCLQQFPAGITLLPVVADGKDENNQPVATHIDRMVNMLNYMNHWQKEWLSNSTLYQSSQPEAKADLEQELEVLRNIANQASDVISALRSHGAVEMHDFEANDFALFFQQFGLSDWHGQYRRLAAQGGDNQTIAEPVHLPETPLTSGMLSLEPVEEFLPIEIKQEHQPAAMEVTSERQTVDTKPLEEASEVQQQQEKTSPYIDQIEQMIHDAQFWIERGHVERGIELLKIAREEYPDDERVAAAFKNAAPELEEVIEKEIKNQQETSADPIGQTSENDANSYDMMGNMALEKGDYLFAKYCWDRVVEVNPKYAGIYRKLGLMTAEHLHDYRETAIHYLQKALEFNSKDKEVKQALASLQRALEKVADVKVQVIDNPVPDPKGEEHSEENQVVQDMRRTGAVADECDILATRIEDHRDRLGFCIQR